MVTMPTNWVQYPDLTEIYVSSYCNDSYFNNPLETMRPLKAKTEFVFGTIKSIDRTYARLLQDSNFHHVASMINWSPFHSDTRTLELWWWKNPKPIDKSPILRPHSWKYNGAPLLLSKHCQASGCGMKLCNQFLAHRFVYRFFTLMRMPIEPNARQRAWLKRFHYHHIDTGTLASYWTNGFSPKAYSSNSEIDFWKQKGIHLDASVHIKMKPSEFDTYVRKVIK